MKEFEKKKPSYMKEFFKVIENTDLVSKTKNQPKLKYDEKPVQAEYTELSDEGIESLRNFFPLAHIPRSVGRKH